MNFLEHLSTPIPRWNALVAIAASAVGSSVVAVMEMRKMTAQANAIIGDLAEKNAILGESVDFLLNRADEATIAELNSNLDFWRVAREMDPPRIFHDGEEIE